MATSTDAADAPGIDLLDPGLPRRLHHAFDDLRAATPVLPLQQGSWLLLRHADVATVLKDRGRFGTDIHRVRDYDRTRPFGAGTTLETFQEGLLVNLGEDDHRRQRAAQTPRYTRHDVEARITALVGSLVDELLGALPDDGEVDLVPALALTLPARVFAELFAIPKSDLPRLHTWTHADTVTMDVLISPDLLTPAELAAGQAGILDLRSYLRDLARRRRDDRGEDLMSFLLDLHDAGALTFDEVLTQAGEALAAGTGTTQTLLAGMVQALAEHPDQWDRVRSGAGGSVSVRTAVEEALRYVSPVFSMGRVAYEDVTLDGVTIPAGDVVQCGVLAANRDPAAFADPHAFDAGRAPNPHVAFGGGTHVCLGQHIARLEARVVLERMAARWARIEPLGAELNSSLMVRTYRSLRVRLRAA